MKKPIDRLRTAPDRTLHPGAAAEVLGGLAARLGRKLPDDHLALLAETDGVEVAGGYLRLFGAADLVAWNEPGCWKFAWPEPVRGHLCFAETGLGDQYAYALADDSIVRIDGQDAVIEPHAESFAEFLEDELLECAVSHYDPEMVGARARLGDLASHELATYLPPLLLGGPRSPERLVKMQARAVMIAQGDVATQVAAAPRGALVSGLEPYVDKEGRGRLRIRWARN